LEVTGRRPFCDRRWLEHIVFDLSLFLFLLAAYFDDNNHSDSDNNEEGDWDEDGFEKKLDKAHLEAGWGPGEKK
jgi:hypothetical protein